MADDFGNTPATAGAVAVGAFVDGVIDANGDRDWFGVQLIAGHNYVINNRGADSQTGTVSNPLLRIYDPAGVLVPGAVNDDGGLNFESQLVVRPTVTGIYYIEAGAFNDIGAGTYRVSIDDVGTSIFRFQAATFGFAGFGTNPSAGGWGDFNTYPRVLGGYSSQRFGSVNGDDAADIVGFGAAGAFVSLATGLGQFAPAFQGIAAFGTHPAGGGWVSQNLYPRQLGDVDADGRTDIVAFGETATFVSLGQIGGTFAPPYQASPEFTPSGFFPVVQPFSGWINDDLHHREVADVNGDARADIIGFGDRGAYVALGTTNPSIEGGYFFPHLATNQFGNSPGAGGWTSQNIFPRFVSDVNGDGRGDIIAFAASGVLVALSQIGRIAGDFEPAFQASTGFGTNADAGGWVNQQLYPRLVGDINADSRADIVGFGAAGTYFALGQADGTFGPTTFGIAAFGANPEAGGWTDNNIFPRALADVTGDRRADIIGFGADGVFVSQSLDPLLI